MEPAKKIPFPKPSTSPRPTMIQPTLDRATRTQQVIVSVSDSENSGLVDGQTVRVEFAVDSDEPGFWIPTEALQPQVRGLWSVLVTDRNSGEEAIAQRRDIEVLATWGTWSRVRGTLEESENVVIEGGTRISAGQKVATVTSDIEFPWQQNNVIRLDESNQEELQ